MRNEGGMWIERIRKSVWILFLAIIGYLLIASIFSTCYLGMIRYITDSGNFEYNFEHTFYIRDTWWLHFVVFFLFSLFLVFKKDLKVSRPYLTSFGVFFCIAAMLVYIVIASQYYPASDQKRVMEIGMAFHHGDYSALETGNYLFKHPHQKGIVLYFQILSMLFGEANCMAFELVNAVWILGAYILLTRLSRELFKKMKQNRGIETAAVCLLFVPYLFYSSYLYGTVVGEFLALLSFYMILLYKRTQKWVYVLAGSVSLEIAIILKSNFQIFLIAVILYLIFGCIIAVKNDKKLAGKNLIFIASLLICFGIGSAGMDSYLTALNQGEKVEGVPMIAYVAMGLQDGKAAPGWYNGYNTGVYNANNFDAEMAAKEAKENIAEIVSGYKKDITASISFFVKKVSSQWNNPTFASLQIMENREGKDGLKWIMSGNARNVYIFLVNLIHTWILAGVFLFGVLRLKKGEWEETLLIITFIGGFMFHLVWEAKSTYSMPFFLLLLPLCASGYSEWRTWMISQKNTINEIGWKSEQGKKLKRGGIITIAVILLICGISYTDIFSKIFARNDDTGIFNTYTQDIVNQDEL